MTDASDSEPTPPPATRPVPVDLRDYVRFDRGGATRVRVFATEVLTVDLWCIEPQQATDVLLYADADISYTVVGGRSWFVTDQGEIGLDALGALLVPAGTAHGIDNRAPDPLIVLATASPPDGDQASTDAPVVSEGRAIRPDPSEVGVLGRVRSLLRGG
ncbi:MAG TPA: hypothetical protein VGA69_04815 [Nitriliruptorales bacterium]